MMKRAVCAVFLILAVSHTSSQQVGCSHGWDLNDTFCYYVETNLTQRRNFWEARRWCKETNGSILTTVLSQRENEFLDHLINETNLRPNETFYIGLRTINNWSTLAWVGEAVNNYTNWYNNSEPELPNDNKQRCAYYDHLHKWQLDVECKTERLFICKQPQSLVSVGCSHRWVLNDTFCYYVETNLTQRRNFWDAESWCKETNGSILTTVLSQRENEFLHHLINQTNLRPNQTFYIGLKTINKWNTLAWVGRAPYNYTNWYNNSEPKLLTDKKRCAYYDHLHKWQLDVGCKTKRLFICKQPQPRVSVENTVALPSGNDNEGTEITPSRENSKGSPQNKKPTSPTVKGSSGKKEKLEETLNKLNEVLDSLEGASINQSAAREYMKRLGADLDSAVNSGPQSSAQLSQVIATSERIGELMVKGLRKGKNITEPKSIQVQIGSLVLGVNMLPPVPSINSSVSVSFPEENKQKGNINLPASLMWIAQRQDGVSISNLLLPNVSVTADHKSNKVLNSGIISSTILFTNGNKFLNLSEPVAINLSSVEANDDGLPSCVFLDLNTDPPSWSSSGCVVHTFSSSRTVCHCYHMTSFAVLMDVHGAYEDNTISEDHEMILSIISIVGCLIAFICYIALLFSFYFLRKRTETLCIHMNLAAAQSFAIFFFLVGFSGVRIKGVCYAFAFLLHYFQLASFCWMMVEGINLLRGMVKVFRVTSRMKTYFLFSWGLPVVVVAVTAGLTRDEYLRDNFCWISHQIIWSFAGPVALILSVNLAVLIVAIKIVVRRTRYKETGKLSALQLELRAAFKTLVILVPLLGVTWILGYVSIHKKSLVFQYLFAVINSLQGLYFLIAQYCFDDDIKTNAHRASSRVKRVFTVSKSSSSLMISGSRSSNKKTAVSPQEKPADQDDQEKNTNEPRQSSDAVQPQQKPEDQDYQEKDTNDPKQSSDDQHNNGKHLGSNQQSNLDQENEFNDNPCQLQEKTTDRPNNEVDPAQGEIALKQSNNETRF